MVKKKDNIPELEDIRKERATRYAVSIRYRDGGVDKYHGVISVKVVDNTIRITESVLIDTYIVLDIVSYFKVEKED